MKRDIRAGWFLCKIENRTQREGRAIRKRKVNTIAMGLMIPSQLKKCQSFLIKELMVSLFKKGLILYA